MKRDKELIRAILLYAETQRNGFQLMFDGNYDNDAGPDFPGYKDGDLAGHLKLLIDDNYLDGVYKNHGANFIMWVKIDSITMKGYDFLDKIRDQGIWAEVKKELDIAGEAWSFEIVSKLAVRVLAKKLGL